MAGHSTLTPAASPSLKDRFVRNATFKSLADAVSRFATFAVTVFLARTLIPAQFGLFSYTLTLSMTWVMFMDFGWNNVLIRRAKEPQMKSLFLSVFVLKMVLLTVGVVVAIAVPISRPASSGAVIFVGCLLYAAAFSFQEYQSAAIAGLERFDLEWIFKLIPRWTPFVLLWIFFRKNPTPSFAATILGFAALGITLLMMIPLSGKFFKGPAVFRGGDFKSLLIEGAPFGLAAVIWGLYTKLDVILLGLYGFPLERIGVYAAGIKIVDFTRGVAMILYMAMIPIFNDHQHNHAKLWSMLRKISGGFALLSLVAVPILFKVAPYLMVRLYGSGYASGALPFSLALTGVFVFLINTPFLAATISLGKGRLSLLGSVLTLLTCFTINLVLLPSRGLMAPATAIVGAESVWLLFNIFILRSRLSPR